MSSRVGVLSAVVVVVVSLCGCSAAAPTGEPESSSGGTIELAVSEICAEDSQAQCVSVDGQDVALPSRFEVADVDGASVAEGADQMQIVLSPDDDAQLILEQIHAG